MMRAKIIGAVVIAATIGFTLTISPAAFAGPDGSSTPGGNHYGVLGPFSGGPVPPGYRNGALGGNTQGSPIPGRPAPGWTQGNKTGWSGVPGVRTR